jgi:uncharacterized membrane protein YtjA (UPF0391 family)
MIFLMLAAVSGVLAFGGLVATASGLAKLLFLVFFVLFLVSLISGSFLERTDGLNS